MSAASDEFPPPEDEPTRALLLAQALDMCISAERRLPGSADHIIAHQPSWAREHLRRLVSLAGSLDAVAASAVMDDDFREAARGRLLQRIGGVLRNGAYSAAAENRWRISTFPSTNGYHVPAVRRARKRRWLWRAGAGGVLAAALGTAATLTASATALPGEPLYQIKQAQEEIGLRFAPDDQALAFALLNQGDARLNETARLLQAGRTGDIALTTRRFDEAIDRATTTFVVTVVDTPAEAPATTSIETKLNAQQAQLESLIVSAPEPARADLRQALMATARGLALVANTQADQSVDRSTSGLSSVAAAVPTTLAESIPTVEPPTVVQAPPRTSSGVAADKRDANATDPRQPEDATAAQTPADAMKAPAAPQVAVNRPARGGLVVPATNHSDRSRSSSSDDQEDEQHFEPVATDSSVIAQVPQVSQQSAPRHLDITLFSNSDSAPASVQSDARHDDERQVAVPSTQADDHPQMAEQPQPAITHAQSPTQSARTASGDEASANSTAQSQNTSNAARVQASTNSGDQHSTSSRGESDKSSHTASANTSSSSSSRSNGNADDNGGKGSGGGGSDHNAKPNTDQSSKGGGDGGHGGNGGHGD